MMSRTAWPSSGPSACHEMQAVSERSSRGTVPPSPAWPAGVYLAMTDDAERSQSIGSSAEWLGRPRSRQLFSLRQTAGPVPPHRDYASARHMATEREHVPCGEEVSRSLQG